MRVLVVIGVALSSLCVQSRNLGGFPLPGSPLVGNFPSYNVTNPSSGKLGSSSSSGVSSSPWTKAGTPSQEDAFFSKWAHKIFVSPTKSGAAKESLLKSAWDEWEKGGSKDEDAVTQSPLESKLLSLGVPTEKAKEALGSIPTIESLAKQLLKLGILPGKVTQVVSSPKDQWAGEMGKIGLGQEVITEVLKASSIESLKEALETLGLATETVEGIMMEASPSPEESPAFSPTMEFGVVPLEKSTSDLSLPPPLALDMSTKLETLGLSSAQIETILAPPPSIEAVLARLETLTGVALKPEVLTKVILENKLEVMLPPSQVTPLLETLPATEVASLVTPTSLEDIAQALVELGVPKEVVAQVLTTPEAKLSEGVVPPEEILSTLPVVPTMLSMVQQLTSLGLPIETIEKVLAPSPTNLEARLLKETTLPASDVEAILLPPSAIPVISETLIKLGVPPSIVKDILTVPTAEVAEKLGIAIPPTIPADQLPAVLISLGLSPAAISTILTPKLDQIVPKLEAIGVPISVVQVPPGPFMEALKAAGVPMETIVEIMTPDPTEVAAKLAALGIPQEKIGEVLSLSPPKTGVAVGMEKVTAKLAQLGINASQAIKILTTPPLMLPSKLEAIGLPPAAVSKILTPPPEILIPKLEQLLGLPPPDTQTLATLPLPQIASVLSNKLKLPTSSILNILTPPLASVVEGLADAGVPEASITQVLTAPPELIASKLLKVGVPAENVTAIVEEIKEIVATPSALPTVVALPTSPAFIPAPETPVTPFDSTPAPPTKGMLAVIAELAQLGINASQAIEILTTPSEMLPSKLTALGLPPPIIEKILTPPPSILIPKLEQLFNIPQPVAQTLAVLPLPQIVSVLAEQLKVPPTSISNILSPPLASVLEELAEAGVPAATITQVLTAPPELIVSKLLKAGIPADMVTTIVEQIKEALQSPSPVPPEALPPTVAPASGMLAVIAELTQLGINASQAIKVLTTPPLMLPSKLEAIGLPPETIAQILTPPQEILYPKLIKLGIPPPTAQGLVALPLPQLASVLSEQLKLPTPSVLNILTPPLASVLEGLAAAGVPPTTITAVLSAPPEVIASKLLKVGIPVDQVTEIIEKIKESAVPPPPALSERLPAAAIAEVKTELTKLGLTVTEIAEILEGPIPKDVSLQIETMTGDAPAPDSDVIELTVPQLKELIQVILEECRKTSKYARRLKGGRGKPKKKHHHKKAKDTADEEEEVSPEALAADQTDLQMKRALYPISITTTTKSPFTVGGLVPQEMWDLVPSVAPNTSLADPAYWAAKKSLFISKLFEALARITMNYTNTTPAKEETPKEQLQKKIDTVLLSDAARSIKKDDEDYDDDEEEEDENEGPETPVDQGKKKLPKEPDNPLHKLFKFGVQKTVLSDLSTTTTTPLPVTTTAPTSTTVNILEQQKLVLDKLKKLYDRSRKAYKKSKKNNRKGKKKNFRGPTTTVNPIDFEELAKALLVQPNQQQ